MKKQAKLSVQWLEAMDITPFLLKVRFEPNSLEIEGISGEFETFGSLTGHPGLRGLEGRS